MIYVVNSIAFRIERVLICSSSRNRSWLVGLEETNQDGRGLAILLSVSLAFISGYRNEMNTIKMAASSCFLEGRISLV